MQRFDDEASVRVLSSRRSTPPSQQTLHLNTARRPFACMLSVLKMPILSRPIKRLLYQPRMVDLAYTRIPTTSTSMFMLIS
jgi:hypothetical protein